MTTGSNLGSSRRKQDLSPAIVAATRSNVASESTSGFTAQSPLEQAIVELQRLHEILLAGDLDPRVLTDFRDALNRVRTAAWAAQQYVIRKETDQDSGSILSLLAGEREFHSASSPQSPPLSPVVRWQLHISKRMRHEDFGLL